MTDITDFINLTFCCQQATVITDSSADGDALSTCCFALGLEEGSALIESLKDVQAVFVTEDYRLHYVGY